MTIRATHAVLSAALGQAVKCGLMERSVAPIGTLPVVESRRWPNSWTSDRCGSTIFAIRLRPTFWQPITTLQLSRDGSAIVIPPLPCRVYAHALVERDRQAAETLGQLMAKTMSVAVQEIQSSKDYVHATIHEMIFAKVMMESLSSSNI